MVAKGRKTPVHHPMVTMLLSMFKWGFWALTRAGAQCAGRGPDLTGRDWSWPADPALTLLTQSRQASITSDCVHHWLDDTFPPWFIPRKSLASSAGVCLKTKTQWTPHLDGISRQPRRAPFVKDRLNARTSSEISRVYDSQIRRSQSAFVTNWWIVKCWV